MTPELERKITPLTLPDIERTVSALGAKLASARAERGWSLAELARRAGVSTASVHKIEKSGMTPTIATLMKVAAALGTSVSFFIDEDVEVPAAIVVRGDERARLYTSKAGIALANVSGRYGRYRLAGAEAVVEPHADSGPEPMRHPGEELVYLLDGSMCFTVDGKPIQLGPGDSIHFRTDRPHTWQNPGARPARALWFMVRGVD
ncbi:MAG TPA: cupin domain-containing protein [Solirubrobacteraceae bacterium]|nr:cupin domain-containing protein [Solirubrobacteraceae bacterium]